MNDYNVQFLFHTVALNNTSDYLFHIQKGNPQDTPEWIQEISEENLYFSYTLSSSYTSFLFLFFVA